MKLFQKKVLCLMALMSSAYLMGMDDQDSPATQAQQLAMRKKADDRLVAACEKQTQEINQLRYINNEYRALITTNQPAPIQDIPDAYINNPQLPVQRLNLQNTLIENLRNNNAYIRASYLGRRYLNQANQIDAQAAQLYPSLEVPAVPLRPVVVATIAAQSPARVVTPVRTVTPVQQDPSFLGQTLTRLYSGVASSPASFRSAATPASAQTVVHTVPPTPHVTPASTASSASLPASTPSSASSAQTVIYTAPATPPAPALIKVALTTPPTPASMPANTVETGSFKINRRNAQSDFEREHSDYLPNGHKGLYRVNATVATPKIATPEAEASANSFEADISFEQEANNNQGLRRAPAYYHTRYDESPNNKIATSATQAPSNEAVSPASYTAVSRAALEEQHAQSPQRAPVAQNSTQPIVQPILPILRIAQPVQVVQRAPQVTYIRKPGIAGKVKDFMVLNNK